MGWGVEGILIGALLSHAFNRRVLIDDHVSMGHKKKKKNFQKGTCLSRGQRAGALAPDSVYLCTPLHVNSTSGKGKPSLQICPKGREREARWVKRTLRMRLF